ncbi:hypothetical protein Tco_0522671 [Tanacetum coccineum]
MSVTFQQCTCKKVWISKLRGGFCLFCASRDGNSSIDAPNPNSFNDPPNIKDYRNERIDIHYRRECKIKIDELKAKFNKMSIEINKLTKEKELRQREQVANLSTPEPSRCFNSIYYDDNDDEESTIPLSEITSQIPPSIAITPSLRDYEPETSNPKVNPRHTSERIVSVICLRNDDFSSIDVPCDNSVTFSNPLFDANDEFTSSDDESLLEEDVPKENFKIYSNPLFEFNDEYISSDVNPLFNVVLEDIESKDSYASKLDEPVLLVTPLSKLNEDKCFDPGGDFVWKKSSLSYSDSIQPGINDDDFDRGRHSFYSRKVIKMDDPPSPLPQKNLILKEHKDTIPNLLPEVFLDRGPRSLEDELIKMI